MIRPGLRMLERLAPVELLLLRAALVDRLAVPREACSRQNEGRLA
jgi:hypothetical protein